MRRTRLSLTSQPERPIPDAAVLEVSGVLDAVGGYDLRLGVEDALRAQVHDLVLDLTRVVRVDPDGLGALRWCGERAAAAGVRLRCAACSRPVRVALREGGGAGGDAASWLLAG
jgi:anti-sigma B factor antagonist